MPGIIAGVDGSGDSRLALLGAMREAGQHRVPIPGVVRGPSR
jgi:hypothetical protein